VDTTKLIKPYSTSIFELRELYPVIFRGLWLADEKREMKKLKDGDFQAFKR
jgi:hypothetical protein